MNKKEMRKTYSNQFQKNGGQSFDLQTQGTRAEAHGDWKTAANYFSKVINLRAAELSLINSVQQGLSVNLDMQSIYNLVGDKLRDTFDAQVVMLSQYDPQTKKVFHHFAIERGRHLNIQGWQPIDSSRLKVVRTRKPFMINLAEIIKLLESSKMKVVPGTELPKTWLGVPMLIGTEVKGIVSLQNLDKENAFTKSDIDLLTTLTNSMTLSLENARLYNETQQLLNQLEREMEIARQTQLNILPDELPKQPGYDFGSLIIPARAVGGDFFDFIHLGNQKLGIVIGDVSDKGLPAALFMALTYSLIRSEAGRENNPGQVLRNVNHNLLNINNLVMYVTLLYAVLDFNTGILEYARAGHPLPIILDNESGFINTSMVEGQPLGLFEDIRIDQQRCTIPRNGLVLFFTDGLNEAVNQSGEEFGLQRIKQVLLSSHQESANTVCKNLWHAVQNYSSEIQHQDDFASVLIKRQNLSG
ncbi:MAG: SpoIIE family protein phosphatase [Anaerolineaceae bacterium]|nr:SpoIIE family protein phosphatase [Anaerolineaceae bacterium]